MRDKRDGVFTKVTSFANGRPNEEYRVPIAGGQVQHPRVKECVITTLPGETLTVEVELHGPHYEATCHFIGDGSYIGHAEHRERRKNPPKRSRRLFRLKYAVSARLGESVNEDSPDQLD